MVATYPYAAKDRLVAADLNLDLELSPGSVPPASALGGAHIYKQWIDTSVTPPVLRMCVGNPASPTYNAGDWMSLASIDVTNKKFNLVAVVVADTPPASPLPGTLWWDSGSSGNLYVSYFDGNSQQWVAANQPGTGVYLPLSGGTIGGNLTVSGQLNASGLATLSGGMNASGNINFPTNGFRFGGSNQIGFAWDGSHLTSTIDGTGMPGRIMAMRGVTDGSNPTAGDIGEYLQAAVGSPGTGIASNTWSNATSLSLTAGDWDVWALASFNPTVTSIAWVAGHISLTSNGANALSGDGQFFVSGSITNSLQQYPTGPTRVSINTTTTVYLNVNCNYTGGSVQVYGQLSARRAR